MNRRTFLKQTGAAAAVTPLLAANLDAAVAQIKHVVVVMMENRSFDHLLGWLPGADGQQAGLTYLDKSGNPQATHELAPDFTGCAYPDPDHSYSGGRTEYANGSMNGFLQTASPGLNAIGYYQETDLPFRSALARNYVTCDRYFCSILGPTFPNRVFQHCGQTDRLGDDLSLCTLPTIWDNLQAAGISHKYYFSNIPYLALWGLKYVAITALYAEFLSDCAAGTLPAVSFVEPTFTTLTNLDEDDHPFSDVRNGDAFLAKTFHALANGPNWANTVFIINFDEWGGFYDHVAPPRAIAPNNVDTDLVNGKALLGFSCAVHHRFALDKGRPAQPNRQPQRLRSHFRPATDRDRFRRPAARRARRVDQTWVTCSPPGTSKIRKLTVPSLPQPWLRFPVQLLLQQHQSRWTCPRESAADLVRKTSTSRTDEESTIFLRMIESGMVKGFPGQ